MYLFFKEWRSLADEVFQSRVLVKLDGPACVPPLMTFSQITELGASAIASTRYYGMIYLLLEEMSIRACQDSVAMSHRTLYCLVESQSFVSLPDAFGVVLCTSTI